MLTQNQREFLNKFKKLDVSLDVVETAVGNLASFNKSTGSYELNFFKPFSETEGNIIPILRADICCVLRKYINNEVDIIQMVNWANFILAWPSYKIEPSSTELEQEEIILIVEELAVPLVSNKTTKEKVKRYLESICK
jgi:hypothetical protein